jgi:3-hydroxybutyryl-CoA dehydrogenase
MTADTPSIQTVSILGLGTMGHGIAQVFATAGYRVRGFDEVAAARDSLHGRCRENLEAMVSAGMLTRNSVSATLSRMDIFDSIEEAVDGCEFVLEVVREDLATKQRLFALLEKRMPSSAILASNTSTFPMTHIAAGLAHPQRCVNMHWFNPSHIVPVVEVIPGEMTSPETLSATIDLAQRIGKTPVCVQKEIPGFIVNRVQAAMIREVWDLWQSGVASAEDIDLAVSGTMGFRLSSIGPLQVCDFGGLDVWSTLFKQLTPLIASGARVPEKIQSLVDAGHFGAKSEKGIFDYTPESLAEKRSARDRNFLQLAKLAREWKSPTTHPE